MLHGYPPAGVVIIPPDYSAFPNVGTERASLCPMPEKNAQRRAQTKKRQGKSASTQAGEYVREEMRQSKQGKHGSRNPKQAIAIGLSKARREGVDVKPPKKGKTSAATRKKAEREYSKGQSKKRSGGSSKRTATKGSAKKSTRKTASKRSTAKSASTRK
jgi:hypothetical protein